MISGPLHYSVEGLIILFLAPSALVLAYFLGRVLKAGFNDFCDFVYLREEFEQFVAWSSAKTSVREAAATAAHSIHEGVSMYICGLEGIDRRREASERMKRDWEIILYHEMRWLLAQKETPDA